jgi:hypothetical protein
MSKYDQIATKIIKEQEALMGPVAWYEARKVKGLNIIDQDSGSVTIADNIDSRAVVDDLVSQYGNLFGRAAQEVCREAVSALVAELSPAEVPSTLK